MEAAGDSAVVLTISHKLSGTYQSACIAAEGRERIFVVDHHVRLHRLRYSGPVRH